VAEILLARQEGPPPSDDDKAAVRRVIFGIIHGLGEVNRKAWARFWNGVLRLEPGEVVEIRTHRERIGWYHRKHMAIEQRVFESQERFTLFDQFRNWLKVGAGHVDWFPGPKGGVVPVPKSISYASMEQTDFEEYHARVIEFLREPHALKTLWPAMPEGMRLEGMDALLAEFDKGFGV
jgi:hypothetical protein